MTGILKIVIRFYSLLLRLYPGSFRNEFAEAMLHDFSDLAVDARKKGRFAFVLFCLHELIDFPINLLRAHLAHGGMPGILHSQPLNSGLRGAVGFGAGFAFTTMAAWSVSNLIYSVFELLIQSLSDRIQSAIQNSSLSLIPFAIYLALTGTIFGLLLALFLGNRTTFYRYVLAGALCWVIPEMVSYILVGSLGEAYYHNANLTPILGYSMCVLIGVFLSATYAIAESGQKYSFRYLAAGIIVYPPGIYLFIKLLFYLWHEITPWFLLSLMAFMIASTACVIAVTMPGRHKSYFVVVAGGIGYFLLNRALFYVAYHIPGFSIALDVGIIPDVLIVPMYYMAIYKAIFGALFGLGIGSMFGVHKKTDPQQVIAIA
ncbi:MAG: hypothetical protein EHM40_07790 [Chloroflexi bacterium]|nr:MAG: hypothetical protein EHM40_07790 [Chloroflexota bacterium]